MSSVRSGSYILKRLSHGYNRGRKKKKKKKKKKKRRSRRMMVVVVHRVRMERCKV